MRLTPGVTTIPCLVSKPVEAKAEKEGLLPLGMEVH
jgi:hypothetical protein